MHIDKQTRLWSSAAITSTGVSTNCYDAGAPFTSGGTQRDVSDGEPLAIVINVETAADHTDGDETYAFAAITATASDLTTSQTVLVSQTISYSLLTAGAIVVIPLGPGSITQRYLGAKATLGGTTPSITVSADVKPLSFVQRQRYYSTAIVIN